MKINVLSDYIKFNNFFGVNGAKTSAISQATALKKYAKVIINSDGQCDIVHSNGCMPYTQYKMLKYKKKGTPIVIYAHQTHHDTKNAIRLSGLFVPLAKHYLKKYYSVGDLLIAPTINSKRIIENEIKTKVEVKIIRNGVNTKNFKMNKTKRKQFRKKWGLNDDFTMISVGMPIKRKGYPTFVNLAKRLKDDKFVWVGKPAFPLLQGKKSSKLSNLVLTGYVKNLSNAYSGADIFCFPSIYEGQGIVILEAASCGLPIIVRDLPSYDEWLIDGKNCLKARTEDEFIEKINFLKNNPKEVRKLSKASLKLARENDIDLMAKKLMKTFKRLL